MCFYYYDYYINQREKQTTESRALRQMSRLTLGAKKASSPAGRSAIDKRNYSDVISAWQYYIDYMYKCNLIYICINQYSSSARLSHSSNGLSWV